MDFQTEPFTFLILSEYSFGVFFEEKLDLETHKKVIGFHQSIQELKPKWLRDTVVSYNSISFYFKKEFIQTKNDLLTIQDDLKVIWGNINPSEAVSKTKHHSVLVDYRGDDLKFVSAYTKLSIPQIIEFHTKPIYTVAAIGFLPGFPYLLGMDARLFVPRKSSVPTIINKGSVGIGGHQTGIYPHNSPGGWQIIGQTDFELFSFENPSVLEVGDTLTFIANKV